MSEENLYFLTIGINSFSRNLHKELKKRDDNDLLSPLSIHALLTLISQDPWFHSRDFFNTALCLDVNHACNRYKDILATFIGANGLQFTNGSFLKHQTQVSEVFGNRIRDNFATEVNFLDFTKPEDAIATINAWVRERTVQKIPPFISLKDDVNFEFLNATKFKGNWAEPFSAGETVMGAFHVNEQTTVDVQMMRRKGEFYFDKYTPFGAEMLKLPFVESSTNVVIVLPKEGISVDEFLKRISMFHYDPSEFARNMSKTEVDVSLPKFKVDECLDLAQYLRKLGLHEVFNANLIGVVDNEELTCSGIVQNAFLEVNEAGADAVSGTKSTLAKVQVLPAKDGIKICEASMSSEITNRLAKTKVVWRVQNTNEKAAEAKFKVVLSDTAFIMEFVMEIEGKSYKSYLKEKEEAKSIYEEAVQRSQSAGLIEAKTRDSREFTVPVNLEPESVVVFSLTYEEMLQRIHDQYELVLNIYPGQIVDDLSIEVRINETRPLKFVKTPPLRSGSDLNNSECANQLDPQSDVKIINPKTATVKFRPNTYTQRRFTNILGNEINNGLCGQFVVQYDIEREPLNGEILLQDGYFVHFFAPNDLDPLPKHVVFLLDTSGSMWGRKIRQLQDAMMHILSDLRKEDMLSIVEFNSDVIVWNVDLKKSTTISPDQMKNFKEPFVYLQECILADPSVVSDDIIRNAKEVVQRITPNGCTFMIGGLQTALYLVKMGQRKSKARGQKLQPIIVFLTDGKPNVGLGPTDVIIDQVTKLNVEDKVPIFSLSFGNSAVKDFLRRLSLKNSGFSRHIYKAADASLQLQDFYRQISSPVLSDIKFKYDADVEVTRSWFPVYFRGSELVVAGRCQDRAFPTTIDCCGPCGPVIIKSAVERPVSSLERLWAYLTVNQLLDERDLVENPAEVTKRAIELALKYSFVTEVTSLVVVKPTETVTIVDDRTTDPDTKWLHLSYERPCCVSGSSKRNRRRLDSFSFLQHGKASRVENKMTSDSSISDVQSFEAAIGTEPDSEDKFVEKFTVNRPFLVFLVVEQLDTVLTIFQSCIQLPTY